MQRDEIRNPLLVRLYHRYLSALDPASFVVSVTDHYRLATLERIGVFGSRESRRAAALALTFCGSYEQRHVFARFVRDVDRGVRMLAEEGVGGIWARAGNVDQQHELNAIKRLNEGGLYVEAQRRATQLCESSPDFGEAWNQKAIAEFFGGSKLDSIQSCTRVLFLNPYHYEAAVGLGHAFLAVDEPKEAVDSFSQALELNPHLDAIRAYAAKLQKSL